ncbi:MAG: autotransporter-associated N-terminal domain-containing protein, partial [Fusobacterium necrophorum]|nr:autotransporter-associated N-terminal domain-containing protein [Fusobacterium necrophorum]
WKTQGEIKTKDYIAHNTVGKGTINFTNPNNTPLTGTVTDISGKTSYDKEMKLQNGNQVAGNNKFFLTLLDVPYSYFGENTKIYSDSGTSIVDLETEGKINVTLEDLKDQRRFDEDDTKNDAIYQRAKKYREMSVAKDASNKTSTLYFNNKGTMELGNDVKFLTVTTHTDGEKRINVIENSGIVQGISNTTSARQQYAFYHSPDTSTQASYVYVNSGKIFLQAKQSAGAIFSYSNISNASAPDAVFVNDGDIDLYGIESAGIAFNKGGNSSAGTGGQGIRKGTKFIFNKAVNLYGDKTVGLYNLEENLTKANESFSTLRAIIGSKNNENIYLQEQYDGSFKKFEANSNENGKQKEWVDNAVGVYNNIDGKLELSLPQLDIEKYSKSGVGIYAQKGLATIENGDIKINGGENNIGLYSVGGDINYKGNLTMGASELTEIGGNKEGAGNIGIYNSNTTKKIDFDGTFKTYNDTGKTRDGIGIYSKGTVNINGKAEIKMQAGDTGNNVAVYSNGAGSTVTLIRGKDSKIEINGNTTNLGIGLYSENGGKIVTDGTSLIDGLKIDMKNSATAVVSVGANSSVSTKYSTISYDGNGYALYSDGQGKIDISGAELTLKGKSTAFDVDLAAMSLPITLDNNTRIKANSDDVIAFNLKGATGLTTVGGIEDSIKAKIATKLGGGISLSNLFDGSTSTKYKVAAVDGGNIIIGNLDKTGISTDTAPEKKDGFQFYNRFLGQRLVATTNSGSTISAKLNNSQAANFNNQVVGLEMNSSKNAFAVTETAIKLVNSTIQAERTDSGTGAIGTFINYGQVDIDSTSKIEVEQTKNNAKAVGVYAVNGSQVSNKGTIEVGGDQSIGVLAMSYRLNGSDKVKDEFGTAAGQGNIKVENATGSNITMSGKNAIGIFADNNKDSATADNDHLVINKGTVTVGKSDSGNAIAIYGNNATIKPESGILKIGEKAIGIYAKDSIVGEDNKALGTVNYTADGGIGIYLKDDGNTSKTTLNGTALTLAESGGTWDEKVGILVDLAADTTLKTKIEVGSLNNVTAYYTQNKNLTVNADGKINENSVGITGAEDKKLTYGDGVSSFTFEVGKKSTGILAKKSGVDLKEKATLKLTGESAIGIYSNGVNGTNSNIDIAGKINPDKDKTIGIYAVNGPTVDTKDGTFMDFGTNAKNSIGLYLAGSKWIHDFNNSGTSINFTSDHAKKNIFAYMQGSKDGNGIKESSIALGKEFKVSPTGTASAIARTIGIYMDTAVKDGGSGEYANNTLTETGSAGSIVVEKQGIGVYAKNEDTSGNKTNKFQVRKLSSKDGGSVGIYTDGNLSLTKASTDAIKITAEDKGIGIYGNKGKITVSNDDTEIELKNQGTGVYLTNASYLNGGKLTLKNSTSGSAAAGIYYTKGSASSQVEHKTELAVNDGNDILALYVDGGINLKNTKAINITKNQGNTAAFVTGNSEFTNAGNITLKGTGTDLQQALGIYVQNGKVTNVSGSIIEVEDTNNATGSLSVGMAAVKSSTGTKAEIVNAGDIKISGDAIGMYVDANSSGENSGTITAKNSGTMKAIGAYVKSNTATFKNTGTIETENIALALQDTAAGKITGLGTLKLKADNAVGVYAKDSKIDFNIVAPTVDSGKKNTVALYAEGATEISKEITSTTGDGHIGVYAKDSGVQFKSGSKVTVGNGNGTNFGIGIYTAPGYSGSLATEIAQGGDKTIGLFLGANSTNGSTINYTGTIGVGAGIGVYVPNKSSFVSKNTTFNVNGGTAIYLKGGTADLGKAGTATINFGGSGGSAVYLDGGKIETGSGLTITGSGSFLTLKNADTTINSKLSVAKDGTGINSIYDNTGGAKDYTLALGSTGIIELNGDKATGIAASVNGLAPANKVTIKNEGTIITTSGNKIVGIFSKGANVENTASAKIDIGANGIGIYTTNNGADSNTALTNKGEIILSGDEAIGILANKPKTTQSFVGGKITGTKDTLTGIYVKESEALTNVKDFTISLGTHAKGLVFDKGKDFTVNTTSANNKITIGDTLDKTKRGIGIAAIETGGTIEKTDVLVGTDSLGLYAKGKEVEFKTGMLKSSTGSSILAYADKKATIKLNTGPFEIAKNGLAIGANGGKIETDTVTTIEVKGEKGIGAFVVGDATDAGSISDKFEVKVKNDGGIGVYTKGKVTSFAKVKEIKGNHSKGYIFDNLADAATISDVLQLQDSNATGQIGIYAMGTGAGITTKGISVMGFGNIGLYNQVNQNLTNNGILTVTDSTSDKNSIGIYSDNRNESTTVRTITTKDAITVGKNSVGIYGKNIGIAQTLASKDITVDEKGIGLLTENTAEYYGKGNISVSGNLQVKDKGAVGIQASNADISVKGLTVGAEDSKGIYSTEKGNITVSDDITV